MATVTVTTENVGLLTAENFSKLHSKNIRIIGMIVTNGPNFYLKWCGGAGTCQEFPAIKLNVALLEEDIHKNVPIQVYGELTVDEERCLELIAHFYRDFQSVNISYYEAAAVSLQDQIWCPFLVPQTDDMDEYISEVTEELFAQ